MLKKRITPPYAQQGAVTLIVTLLIMIALTLGSFAMVQTSMFETRMTANDQRSREAFQSAQSGIDFVLSSLATTEVDRDVLCDSDVWAGYGFELDFDGGLLFDAETQASSCNGIPYGIITRMTVWSRGYSLDRSSVRTLASTIDLSAPWQFIPPLPPPTGAGGGPPVVAKGDMSWRGSASEVGGCSMERGPFYCGDLGGRGRDPAIYDGSTTALLGGQIRPDASGSPDYAPFVTEGDEIGLWSDDQFFEFFMGETKAEFIANACDVSVRDCSGALQIYVPPDSIGTITGGPTNDIGGVDDPRRIFFDGPLEMRGGMTLWGTVYATSVGFEGRGNPKIMGRLLSQGDVEFRGTGGVYGNSELVKGPPESEPPPEALAQFAEARKSFLRLGSWREVRTGI